MLYQDHEHSSTATIALVVGVLGILSFLAVLGGLPAPEQVSAFVIGLAVLIGITISFGVAGWHLLYRPLPAKLKSSVASPMTLTEYQYIAIGFLAVHIMLTIGGMWDEIWHTKFGVPFGEDFFWRPHIMMYAGFLGALLLGAYAWYTIIFRGKGTLQQRFRANRIVGVLALFGAFMAYALPADPIWHAIYGDDLSPWSIPHVLLVIIWVGVAILGSGFQLQVMRERDWRSILHINLNDLIPIVTMTFVNLIILIMFAAEWDASNSRGIVNTALNEKYPVWLFPVFVIWTSTLCGVMVNMVTKRYGTATLVGILTIATRIALTHGLDHIWHSANPWLLALGPLVMIDIAFHTFLKREEKPTIIGLTFAVTVGIVIITVPMMSGLYAVPTLTENNIVSVVIAGAIGAALASWLALEMGNFVVQRQAEQAQKEQATIVDSRQLAWVTPVIFALLVLFIVWYIATALPPVAV